MTSPTKKMKMIAKRKKTRSGYTRKRATAAGTTPRFPVHVEDAPDCELPQPPGTDPTEK